MKCPFIPGQLVSLTVGRPLMIDCANESTRVKVEQGDVLLVISTTFLLPHKQALLFHSKTNKLVLVYNSVPPVWVVHRFTTGEVSDVVDTTFSCDPR